MSLRTIFAAAVAGASLMGTVSGGDAQERAGWRTDFSKHTVPLEEIVAGALPKDGVAAIDLPRFVTVHAADRWLSDAEPVIVVEVDDDVRAYPYRILIRHAIVNDRVGGVPLAVTFCALCNTALVFERRHEGRVLTFGVSGLLRHSVMVMFDRETESWWQQATGEGIVGQFAGQRLEPVWAQTVSWAEFGNAFPHGRVLLSETGFHPEPRRQS